MGFTCYVHPEIEFFLLKDLPDDGSVAGAGRPGRLLRPGLARRRTALPPPGDRDPGGDGHLGRVLATTRARPGQQEIDLRYADALTMADNIMSFRYVVKEVALTQGVRASFMPKPFVEQPGIGDAHALLAVRRARPTPSTTRRTSTSCRPPASTSWPACIKHAPEITAVSCQWVNSYKRLVVGDEAPTTASWGTANRSALVRVPNYSPGKSSSQRLEFRLPDSACNPYLMYTVVIAAGLKGIREEYELPAPAEDNVWSLSEVERRAMGYQKLPTSLESALAVMEGSELVAEALGEHVFDFFLRNKRGRVGGLPAAGHPAGAEAVPVAVSCIGSDLTPATRKSGSRRCRRASIVDWMTQHASSSPSRDGSQTRCRPLIERDPVGATMFASVLANQLAGPYPAMPPLMVAIVEHGHASWRPRCGSPGYPMIVVVDPGDR